MAILYGALIGIAGIFAILILIGFLSPRHTYVVRKTEIDAPPEKVWPQLSNLRNFVENWSPWSEKDPNAKHEFNEITDGVGCGYTWVGDPKKVGSGEMKVVESEPLKRSRSWIFFKGRGEAYGSFHLSDLGNGRSEVKWDFEKDNKSNPFGRLFGRVMDKFLGPDFERGLDRLKKYVEEGKAA